MKAHKLLNMLFFLILGCTTLAVKKGEKLESHGVINHQEVKNSTDLSNKGLVEPNSQKQQKSKELNNSESLPMDVFLKAIKELQSSKSVGIKVEKKVEYALLGETKKSTGNLWLSKDKLKLVLEGEDAHILIMNDKIIWMINEGDKDFGLGPQVTKIDSNKAQKSNRLFAGLLGDDSVWSSLKVESSVKNPGGWIIELVPSEKKEREDFKKLKLAIIENKKSKKEIAVLGYWDELNNYTEFKFKEYTWDIKLTKGFFDFTPPKGAEINNF